MSNFPYTDKELETLLSPPPSQIEVAFKPWRAAQLAEELLAHRKAVRDRSDRALLAQMAATLVAGMGGGDPSHVGVNRHRDDRPILAVATARAILKEIDRG